MIRLDDSNKNQYRKLDSKNLVYSMNQVVGFTLQDLGGGWEEVTYYGEAFIDPTNGVVKPQYVYIMVNASVPGICKIGFTTTSVYQRAREISAATGVVSPWYPVFTYKCGNGEMLEMEVHRYLEQRDIRINDKREGFAITSDAARIIIEQLGKKYQTNEI